MNALATPSDARRLRFRPGAAYFDDLPPDAPLQMPVQSLREPPPAVQTWRNGQSSLRLGALIFLTIALTGAALAPICRLLGADGIGPLDVPILVSVGLLFAWSAFSFLSALAGFLAMPRATAGGPGPEATAPLVSRTAVLMPIYNEAPGPVFARLRAICESAEAAGGREAFDFFVLSDSTDPAVRAAEYGAFQRLRARLGWSAPLFYRHRPDNLGRKAGNVADWVRRFGGAYDHMVVLDADSLLEGATLVRLARAMERAPDVGLIQTPPTIVNRHTLFARAEQFASRLYGPMLAYGVAWWSGSEGNYWGHNAIIRVEAFARHAGLPRLRGPKPFGGHILSHDFVEAALLRRAGWGVRLACDMGGSYEESPPTLAALMARDRRWSQGNLQHAQVLFARGLHWISRFHLLRGISAYLVGPLWLLLIGCAASLPLRPQLGVGARAAARVLARASTGDLRAVELGFAASLALLIAPKLMAYARMLVTAGERVRFGGAWLAAVNMAVETVLSTLAAPLIMVSHARSVVAVLLGRDSGWAAQAREASGFSLRQALTLHWGDTLMGGALLAAAVAAPQKTWLWMAPVLVSLVFAAPLAVALASDRLGRAARRVGLLLTPEERQPPQVLVRANAHRAGWPPG